jgi:acetylglutamate kinase
VLRDVDDPSTLISKVTANEVGALVDAGTVSGGMIPKVDSCLRALAAGVSRAHLLDGRVPHVLLLEIFTREGVGTMVERR